MLGRKGIQLSCVVTIVLNEHEVPDFDEISGAGIDLFSPGVTSLGHVDVDLGTGTARTRFSHFPEIVFRTKPQDVAVVDVRLGLPALFCFIIGLENGRPQPLFRKFPHNCQ